METRKVQITGGSTYTVSLPKRWSKENDVQGGSVIAFYADREGLILAPHDDAAQIEGKLDVSAYDDDDLIRAMIAMYVNGFDVITFETARITSDKRRAIRAATQDLAGLEVIEESGNKIVVQDLLNSSQLSIADSISRMQVITVSMIQDAVAALTKNDDELAQDIINHDDDVDRLWFVVSRTFRRTLRTPSAVEEIGFSREVCFDFYTSARQLERIADHAAKISQVTLKLEEIPENVARSITQFHENVDTIIATAMEALLTEDRERATRLANEGLQAIPEVDEHSRDIDGLLCELDSYQAHQLRLSVDSLSRCADYGGNIAETALQKAAPRP